MIRDILSVGGLTLLSRVTGFMRDVALGAILGAGWIADAFVVAFRLPNHFRAIFGEGAFNAAYVPAYARVLETQSPASAKIFSGRIYTLLLASQLVLLALAMVFTSTLVGWLAPGFRSDPAKFDLAVNLTRITFPYLLFVTLVTLHSGTLNANRRFAAAAFAPVLLNLSMIAALAVAFLFPDAGYAAAWGVVISGALQLALVMMAERRAGIAAPLERPRLDIDVRKFFRALGPAVIGSAGIQIALFADTIIGSLLPTGGPSSIYYADRIYQLPLGIIAIAAGTVLLPHMSRAIAAGDDAGALHAQNRTMALTIALTVPFFVAFLTIPDLIMRAAFVRGAFTAADASASANVLAAYAVGLIAIALISSARASFQSRGDTTIPMMAALLAVACNVGVKVLLFKPYGAAGLAFATAIGAWINCGLLAALALRAGSMQPDSLLGKTTLAASLAGLALWAVAWFGFAPTLAFAHTLTAYADVMQMILLGALGALVYAAIFVMIAAALGLRLSHLHGKPNPNIVPAPEQQ